MSESQSDDINDSKTDAASAINVGDLETAVEKIRFLKKAAADAARGTLSMVLLDYEKAAEYFKQAATEVPTSHPSIRREYLFEHAKALFNHGEQANSCPALVAATEAFRTLLTDFPREQNPLEWADTQFALGKTLESLGKRESDAARLQEAVTAYRDALTERARDFIPFDLAETQYSLGCALDTLGTLFGATYLHEAIEAYQGALTAREDEDYPVDKATEIQNKLGNAMVALMMRSSDRMRPQKIPI
ncbi:MAG TPA: hypothetical protein VGZ00_04780 [Candidatus Baltobacteraceae bacterium]|jgi:tetratricopeptide (TPR) repeat protein|nr:hypothetical protein [Candidatus Baltobacteraceae bacterium]